MSEAEKKDLLKPVSDQEVKEAIFQQDGDRAPGPDGFPGYFFHKFWDVVGADVCKAMKHFFRSGKIKNQHHQHRPRSQEGRSCLFFRLPAYRIVQFALQDYKEDHGEQNAAHLDSN